MSVYRFPDCLVLHVAIQPEKRFPRVMIPGLLETTYEGSDKKRYDKKPAGLAKDKVFAEALQAAKAELGGAE